MHGGHVGPDEREPRVPSGETNASEDGWAQREETEVGRPTPPLRFHPDLPPLLPHGQRKGVRFCWEVEKWVSEQLGIILLTTLPRGE